MARTFILKVTKVTYSPNAPWMVRIPPGLWQLEGQKKKFFDKESVAKSYKERLGRLMVYYQLQAAALTDAQRLEAHDCFGQLEPLRVTLPPQPMRRARREKPRRQCGNAPESYPKTEGKWQKAGASSLRKPGELLNGFEPLPSFSCSWRLRWDASSARASHVCYKLQPREGR